MEYSILEELKLVAKQNNFNYEVILNNKNEILNDIRMHLDCEKKTESEDDYAIEVIRYSDGEDATYDICVECNVCNEVIFSMESYLG